MQGAREGNLTLPYPEKPCHSTHFEQKQQHPWTSPLTKLPRLSSKLATELFKCVNPKAKTATSNANNSNSLSVLRVIPSPLSLCRIKRPEYLLFLQPKNLGLILTSQRAGTIKRWKTKLNKDQKIGGAMRARPGMCNRRALLRGNVILSTMVQSTRPSDGSGKRLILGHSSARSSGYYRNHVHRCMDRWTMATTRPPKTIEEIAAEAEKETKESEKI